MPRIDTLERLALALGVPVGWLAYGEGAVPSWLSNDGDEERL